MPARRFWMMERQIYRIEAEEDLRRLGHDTAIHPPTSSTSKQMLTDYIEKLTLQIGEKCTVRRNMIVAPEPDAAAKFLKITGG